MPISNLLLTNRSMNNPTTKKGNLVIYAVSFCIKDEIKDYRMTIQRIPAIYLVISHGTNYPTYQTYKEARYLCCSQLVHTMVVLHLTSTNTWLRLVPTT